MGTSNTSCINLFTRETVAYEEFVSEEHPLSHRSKIIVANRSSRFSIFTHRSRIKRSKSRTTVSGTWLSTERACLFPSGISTVPSRMVDRRSRFVILVIRTIWLLNVLPTISNSKRSSMLAVALMKAKSPIQRTLKAVFGHSALFFSSCVS